MSSTAAATAATAAACGAFLAVAALASLPLPVGSVFLAKSELQSCRRWGGAGPDPQAAASGEPVGASGIRCKNKLVVAMTVAAGDVHGTEQVEAFVDSARVGDDTTAHLASPILIALSKQRPSAEYTLRYVASVNNKPFERVVKQNHDAWFGGRGSFLSGGNCDAHSCSFASDAQGNSIKDSEGTCCTCSASDQVRNRLPFGACAPRANLPVARPALPLRASKTTHTLKLIPVHKCVHCCAGLGGWLCGCVCARVLGWGVCGVCGVCVGGGSADFCCRPLPRCLGAGPARPALASSVASCWGATRPLPTACGWTTCGTTCTRSAPPA